MERYLPYDPSSTVRVEEQISVRDNRAFLRHIPKEGSIEIDGFTEVDGAPIGNQFFCDYAKDSLYRDANRVIVFGSVDDFTFLTVNYIAVGTVVTSDDMNEIKAHLENDSLHGGAGDSFFHNVDKFVCFYDITPSESSWNVADYEQDFQAYAGRPSKKYDIANWVDSGSGYGWAIRIDDKWIKLSAINGYPGSDSVDWSKINPILSVKDRQKLDSLTEPYQIGDGFYLQNNTLNLQTANANSLGGVKVGDGLQLNNSAALCLKAATASQLGGIKIGDGFYLQNNTLYLQTANANSFGGVKVGDGLQVNNSAALCLKGATASQLGGIKIGNGLVKDLHEVLSVELP
ncbi:MAG: hypothetical protein IJP42_06215, partial [Selenomonadaceae bacterium]|nr:hypothetical protein [Selenomonadaceae bacterium]